MCRSEVQIDGILIGMISCQNQWWLSSLWNINELNDYDSHAFKVIHDRKPPHFCGIREIYFKYISSELYMCQDATNVFRELCVLPITYTAFLQKP